jgi:hypothetical protein
MPQTGEQNMKTYILQSRHSHAQGVTRYLMAGGRHQLTRSPKWAMTFTSFEDACNKAQKVGGMKVVEVAA